jgi:hypothetical protein
MRKIKNRENFEKKWPKINKKCSATEIKAN